MTQRHLFATLKNRIKPSHTVDLVLAVRGSVQPERSEVVGVCPSSVSLTSVTACKGDLVIAAQNCGWVASYSLTGEISPADLGEYSIRYCIVGHSERRVYLNETESTIEQRLASLLAASITPILCVGESLEERQQNLTGQVLALQLQTLRRAFDRAGVVPRHSSAIIAYEPMWAISTAGSSQTLAPSDAKAAHQTVRQLLNDTLAPSMGDQMSVIFGGSVNEDNAKSFFAIPGVDGGLVGSGMQSEAGFLAVLRDFYETG
jgi:triosephosphate isomerase